MAGGVSRRLAARRACCRVVVAGARRSAGERWSIHLMPGVSLSPCRTTDITTASAPIVKDSVSGGELGRKDQQRVSHRAYALRPEPGDKRFGSRAESGARMCAGRRARGDGRDLRGINDATTAMAGWASVVSTPLPP